MLSSAPSSNNPKKSRGRPVHADDKKSKKSRDAQAGFQKSIFSFFATMAAKHEEAARRHVEEQKERDDLSLDLSVEMQDWDLPDFSRDLSAEMQGWVHKQDTPELGYDSDYEGIRGADFDDYDDNMQGRQEVEAEKATFSKMPTIATVTEEMANGFWDASQVASLNKRLQQCTPAPDFPPGVVRDAAYENYQRQQAEAFPLRVESPLQAMLCKGLGDSFMLTSWCTARNSCMKTVKEGPVEDADDALQFDSLANFSHVTIRLPRRA